MVRKGIKSLNTKWKTQQYKPQSKSRGVNWNWNVESMEVKQGKKREGP